MDKWIDTHAHYNHKRFGKIGSTEQASVIKRQRGSVQKIINIGTNIVNNAETLDMVNMYEDIYGTIGFFPTDVWVLDNSLCEHSDFNWSVFQEQLKKKKVVGLGEIGLDYHWDKCGHLHGNAAREMQKKWFRNQIELASSLNMPVCIHSRDAKHDTMKMIKELKTVPGVVHAFAYDSEAAKCFLDAGLYLGVGGTSTYKRNNELRTAIKMCPIERILLETDAPYLSPEPVRKETNNSTFIAYVIDNIADIKGMSREDVIAITNKNAEKLFNFTK